MYWMQSLQLLISKFEKHKYCSNKNKFPQHERSNTTFKSGERQNNFEKPNHGILIRFR